MAVVSNCLHNSTQIAGNVLSSNRNVLKSLKGFRIGHLNITLLVKHVDELRIYMEDKPFDILSINESRLDDTVNLNTVDIQGYKIFTKSRNREHHPCCTLLSRQSYGYQQNRLPADSSRRTRSCLSGSHKT